ncbi:MAG: MFS transporter [Chlamydiales bacterium]|nr:MFS transporter [Chlamydiales bacterium]NCF70798.1 MFS transporter [Chlamydiales bacterium]
MDIQFSVKGFTVWGICALFFLYEFFLRTVLGTYQHPLMSDLNLTTLQFSLLSSTIFFLIYGCMQVPVGLIIDNIGLKKSLLIGSLACTIASIGFAYSYNYPLAVFWRMFMGFGAAFGFICLLIAVHEWMPHRYSAIFIGISQFIGTLGPMLAAGPLEEISLSKGIDWRMIFLILGAFGAVLVVLVALFVEGNVQKAGEYTILNRPFSFSRSFKRLFSRPQPWAIALLSACLYFSLEYLSENEGRNFLVLKGLSVQDASYMITISWIGYAVGCPLLGLLSDLTQRRKPILYICALLGVISVYCFLYHSEKSLLLIAFFLLGFSASAQTVTFALMAEQFKKQFVAVGFGLNNGMITVLSAINAPIIGLLLDGVKESESYSIENYVLVFSLLLVLSIVAFILSGFIVKETYCKSMVDFTLLDPNKKEG